MIVFMLGIPGCGKSEFYRRLTKKLEENGLYTEFPRVDDFPKLWDIFMKDEESGKFERCRKTDDDGYKVTDDTVWDDILKEVNKDVLKMREERGTEALIFIEFSRPNMVHSVLNNFSQEILDDSVVVYLDVPFDICWERNVRRHEKALEAGTDDHLVSREEMEKTYGSDDKDEIEEKFPMEVVFINNDTRDPDDYTILNEGVDRVYEKIEKAKN